MMNNSEAARSRPGDGADQSGSGPVDGIRHRPTTDSDEEAPASDAGSLEGMVGLEGEVSLSVAPPGTVWQRATHHFTTAVAASWMLFHIWATWTGGLPMFQQLTIVLGFAFTLVFIWYPLRTEKRTGRRPWWAFALDSVLFTAGLSTTSYIALNHQALQLTPRYSTLDVAIGIVLVFIALEGTRRVLGVALPIFALLCIAFAYAGGNFFGPLSHSGYTTDRIFPVLSLSRQGIFSIPLAVVGSFLALYMILAAALQVSGTGEFFIQVARSVFGKRKGGVAKVALMSSGAYGTMSGAGAANVATTGAFTIPMMKARGYDPRVAAAFEGVASLGGQLMPPVMGAAAFIIASFLGISYGEVILAATLPAIFYYWALYWVVDFEARKSGLESGLENEEMPSLLKLLLGHGYHVIPLLVILWGFMVAGYSPGRVGLFAVFSAIFVSWVRPESRILFRRGLEVLVRGARMLVQLTMAVATVGVVIGVVSLTGTGLKLSGVLIDLSGGSLFLLLFYTMIASLILGAGLPTTPTYLLLAILIAPALGDAGITLLAAHLFIYYYGVLGDMTPPLAVAPMIAASIAETNVWRTMFTATRVGLAAWLIPFMFVYKEGFLMMGGPAAIAEAVVSGTFGLFLLAAAVQQHIFRRLTSLETGMAAIGSFALVFPGLATDFVGLALFVVVMAGQVMWRRQEQAGKTVKGEVAQE